MKKNMKDKVPRKGGKPFFAHLLEAQELEQVSGGRTPLFLEPITAKYPSDGDEDRSPPITQKFPSDRDDHEGGGYY